MALFGRKETEQQIISPVLPDQIYESGLLELRDIIAPAALKIEIGRAHV